ncbi:MAG: hypothetical protein JO270_09430 [Acidobacteriaceae bacterium]|nr:hypothetical protein [Acidobacteriaceae bacterium]
MTVKQAREAARQWILEEAGALPGFCAAYTAGSTNWLPDHVNLATTSDVDVMVVLDDPNEERARRKFIFHEALLEVSYLRKHQFELLSQILSDYHLAPSLRTTKIVFDPNGFLAPLLHAVSRDYAKRQWVRQRCANAKEKILRSLRSLDDRAALHDQVITTVFTAGITTHVLLVAGLRNPTVRTRYQAVRSLLADYGHIEFHERLLALLGAARISRSQASQHLAALIPVFDTAKAVIKTPFPFASDVSDRARSIAIDGSSELIDRGYHREAMFWIAVTHSRCQKILTSDAPGKLAPSFMESYQALVGNLGLPAPSAVRERCLEVERTLPQVSDLAGVLISANREIEDG